MQVTCEKDAILFKEGDVPEKLFLVREGDVLVMPILIVKQTKI